MKRILFAIATLVATLGVSAQPAPTAPTSVLIKLAPEPAAQIDDAVAAARRSGPVLATPDVLGQIEVVPALAQAVEASGATAMRRLFRTDPRHAARHRAAGLDRWYVVEVPKGETASAAARLAAVPEVEVAEEDQIMTVDGRPVEAPEMAPGQPASATGAGAVIPNDPRFGEQWHYHNTGQTGGTVDADIDLPEAWATEMGSSAVVVHVNDSGIDLDHPDLVGALWTNPGEIAGNGFDDDGNGYVDDVHGWSFARSSADVDDAYGHGTHVAGTIGAVTNNGVGVAGIAGGTGGGDGVRILSTQWSVAASGSLSAIAAGMVYAADNGAVISNNSHTAGRITDPVWTDVAEYFATNATGAISGGLIVATAGNDRADRGSAFELPILVSATGHTDQKAYYSAYGAAVDVSAPGGETSTAQNRGVLSTVPGGGYDFYQGTSMAAPHVAGVAALYASANPGGTAAQARAAIEAHVDPLPAEPLFGEGKMGSGRINAATLLETIVPVVPAQISVSTSPISVTLASGGSEATVLGFSHTGSAEAVDLRIQARALAHAPDQGGTVATYTVSDSREAGGPVVAFVDISGTGEALGLGDDDSAQRALPFSFPYFGTAQSGVTISSNGYLTFGGSGSELSNAPIPSAGGPQGVVAVFWDDLNPSAAGEVYVQDLGDGRWVAQWNVVPVWGTTPANTFQAILHQDGTIEFQYEAMNGSLTFATVGVERPDETAGVQVVYNGAYLASDIAVRFVPTDIPAGAFWATGSVPDPTLAVGESGAVTVAFDAAGMDPGTYPGTLTLRTNDPDRLTVEIPLSLTVAAAHVVEGTEGWRMLGAATTVDGLLGSTWTQGFPGADVSAGGANVYLYEESAGGTLNDGYRLPTSASEDIDAGRGLFAYLFEDDDQGAADIQGGFPKTLLISGAAFADAATPFRWCGPDAGCTAPDAALSHTLAGSATPGDAGWNLLANPDAVDLDWDEVALTATDAAAYVYDPSLPGYRVRSAGVGNLADGLIGTYQAFWARAQSTAASIARTPTTRRPASEAPSVVALTLTASGGERAEAFLALGAEGAEPGLDALDGRALVPAASRYVMLATEAADADGSPVGLAIDHRPWGSEIEAPLAVESVNAGGDLTLSWPGLAADFPETATATLHDRETGASYDLREPGEVEFSVEPGQGRTRSEGVPGLALFTPSAPEGARGGASRFAVSVTGFATSGEERAAVEWALSAAPNPSSGAVTLRYGLPESGRLRLSVYDVLGREVAVLHDGEQSAGTHRAEIAGGLAAGAYVVRLASETGALTQTITVIR